MNARPILTALLVAGLAPACASSSSPPAAGVHAVEPPVVAADRSDTADPVCQAVFHRMRTCTDVWIPALVALRVDADVPAGIAETDRTMGRDALVARAREEWSHDSTDEAIGATCRHLTAALAPDDAARVRQSSQACLAEATCEGFTACISPVVAAHLHPGS
jgi:hypothetical protein